MSAIELENITKEFGSLVAVDDISLEVQTGELLCLLGPSGCGKSTAMRMAGGLDRPTDGRVYIDGEDVTRQPAYDRDCSIVFQEWALFPHKTVLENVAFGLKMAGVGKAERREQAREILEMVKLGEFVDSRPEDLSGGQQQRVALARSLVIEPHVLLLDEPLSNLDKRLKEEMQIELKGIHERLDQTMVHVTHDQNEAFTLADRIGIMNDGRLVQVGEPSEVYNNPKNKFVEEFLGDTNIVNGTVQRVTANSFVAETDLGRSMEIPFEDKSNAPNTGDAVAISLRPENLTVQPATPKARIDGGTNDPVSSVTGRVTSTIYRGSMIRYYVDVDGRELFVEKQHDPNHDVDSGQDVSVEWDPKRLATFDRSGARLTSSSE